MNKKGIVAGAVLLVLLVIVVGGLVAPDIVGQRIEKRLRAAAVQQAGDQGKPVAFTNYDRGWFSSRATLHLGAPPDDAVLHLAIQHGPWVPLGWANARVKPVRIGSQGAMAHFFDGPAFVMHVKSSFGGAIHGTLVSPSFDRPLPDGSGGRMVWGGAKASYDANGDQGTLHLRAPRLTVSTPDASAVDVRGVRVDSKGATFGNLSDPDVPIDWNGGGKMTVDKMMLASEYGRLRLDGGAKLQADMHETDDHTVQFDYQLAVSKAHWQPADVSAAPLEANKAQLKLRLAGLEAKPLATMLRALQSLPAPGINEGTPADQVKQRMAKANARTQKLLASYLPKVLSGTPSLSIKIPHVDLSTGGFKAGVLAKLQPAQAVPALQAGPSVPPVAALLLRLQVDASTYLDQPLVARITNTSDRPEQARRVVAAYLRQGLLEKKNGALGARLHYQAGQATLNDRPLPSNLLGALLGRGLQSQ